MEEIKNTNPEDNQAVPEAVSPVEEATEATENTAAEECTTEEYTDEAAKTKRTGKYKFHMSKDDYYAALMGIERANGHHRMYRNVAIFLLLISLFAIYDMIRNPTYALAILSSGALLVMATWIKDIDRRNAMKVTRKMSPQGLNFTLELKKEGVMVHDNVGKPLLMPYSFFKSAYEHGNYLSVITNKNVSLNMPIDNDNAAYVAISDKLKKELGEHYKVYVEKDTKK